MKQCDIKVHYQGEDKSFDAHVIKPKSPSVGVIELAFIHGHYDLVIKSKNVITKEGVGRVNINDNVIEGDDNRLRIDATCLAKGNWLVSGCNMLNTDGNRLVTDGICLDNDGNELDDDNIWLDIYGNRLNTDINGIATDGNGVYNEDDRLDIDDSDRNELGIADGRRNSACIGIDDCIIDIHSHSDGEISSSSDSPDEVKYQGKRKYLQECLFEETEAVLAEHVPNNIDGTSVFIVLLHNGELSNLRAVRMVTALKL